MQYKLIAAYDVDRGIGVGGTIPWKLPGDMKYFKTITTQTGANCVIMGRKTWESLPYKYRPLPDRFNIVLSHTEHGLHDNDGWGIKWNLDMNQPIWCSSLDYLDHIIDRLRVEYAIKGVFFIGGADIYKQALSRYSIAELHLTQVLSRFNCDARLPIIDLSDYAVRSESTIVANEKTIPYRIMVYVHKCHGTADVNVGVSEESKYLNMLRDIIHSGQYRHDRTGVGTLSLFKGLQLSFSLENGRFPLLTTKRVFWKGVAEELLFFLSGLTNVKILQNKGVRIWDGNSNREYLDTNGLQHLQEGDLGKFYGFQWRHWGADYVDCNQDYTNKGFDQVQDVINLIKNSPTSRRIILTAWNPADLKQVCLPPCHVLYQFYVDTERKTLSCSMYQRSADMFLGVPFNIASTALLTRLLAQTCDLRPGAINLTFGDAHVYVNHIAQVLEQCGRTPRPLPQLKLLRKCDKVEDYTLTDLEIVDYNPYQTIKGTMAA